MSYEIRVINGVEVRVCICPPSKRKAHAKTTYYRKGTKSHAANWIARDRGLAYLPKGSTKWITE